MTVKELIAHLETFDENSVITISVTSVVDGYWNVDGIVETHDYVILFNGVPLTKTEIHKALEA